MPDSKTVRFGYKLSSEEFPATELVRQARMAEEHGFSFALISDHFHPWTGRQGQSPFVWGVLGGIAHSTQHLLLGTAVTCPTVRMHPAIVAHAAATAATMMPGRFFLGVGTGENLNEHIVGERWAEVPVRQEKLAEAIQVIRLLWQGGLKSHHGKYYTVEGARLYSLPDQPPPLLVAVAGPKSGTIAAELGDGLIGTQPDSEIIRHFQSEGGSGKPCYGEISVCFDEDEKKARQLAKDLWPIAGMPGVILTELPLPSHFERVAGNVTEQSIAQAVPCGPDPEKHLQMIRKYIKAGYDNIFIHQIGPNQDAFMDFYAREILPRVA